MFYTKTREEAVPGRLYVIQSSHPPVTMVQLQWIPWESTTSALQSNVAWSWEENRINKSMRTYLSASLKVSTSVFWEEATTMAIHALWTLKTFLNASWQSLYTVYHSEVSSCVSHRSFLCQLMCIIATRIATSQGIGWNLPIDGETEGFSVAIAYCSWK